VQKIGDEEEVVIVRIFPKAANCPEEVFAYASPPGEVGG
jgi:hypothetical protein